jgi:hypothetical protein
MIYEFGGMESHGGIILTGKSRITRRKCASATLSTTNPTWIDPGTDPGLRVESLVTNRLSHGMAITEYNGPLSPERHAVYGNDREHLENTFTLKNAVLLM